jgi:nitrogen regulatory protein PII-like uncharacterized protein
MVEIVAKWFKFLDLLVSTRNVPLYKGLIDEEYTELKEATDIESTVDALVDLMWVTSGCLINLVGEEKALKAINEVRRSNFSKIASTEQVAKLSVESYAERGIEAAYRNTEGGYIVYRITDNKILKPITFLEPDWSWLGS